MRPRLVFVDGIDRIDVDYDCEAVVCGALVLSIAAASIVGAVRPPDDADQGRSSGLRLRAARDMPCRALPCTGGARPHGASPPQLRPGRAAYSERAAIADGCSDVRPICLRPEERGVLGKSVARMERSVIRERLSPHCASLHAGYTRGTL